MQVSLAGNLFQFLATPTVKVFPGVQRNLLVPTVHGAVIYTLNVESPSMRMISRAEPGGPFPSPATVQ